MAKGKFAYASAKKNTMPFAFCVFSSSQLPGFCNFISSNSFPSTFPLHSNMGDWVKEVKVLRRTDWYLENSHRDVKYRIGDIVNHIVITIYGAK